MPKHVFELVYHACHRIGILAWLHGPFGCKPSYRKDLPTILTLLLLRHNLVFEKIDVLLTLCMWPEDCRILENRLVIKLCSLSWIGKKPSTRLRILEWWKPWVDCKYLTNSGMSLQACMLDLVSVSDMISTRPQNINNMRVSDKDAHCLRICLYWWCR